MLSVNEYYDGKVKSIAFQGATLPATVGVISSGEYEFGTKKEEVMTVVRGALTVQLPGSDSWIRYGAGDTFKVAANASFKVKAEVDTAYFCTYE
ncbi:pyrimidine/purine nucleoside phosphorylase [Marinobacter sp.]|uniref:pyrimidine/purine nucleoside phosphorylase n=1 Tax=Marinobacter sp. TaxID=50741 RepID=UPI002B26FFF5|nr:pyrimidine/purine nucleoside phosphorylase [Marinobacter sp.]